MFSFLWTVLIGFVVGVVAKMLTPGRDPGGFLVTAIIGIAGSFIAGFLGRAIGIYAQGQAAGFMMSVLGAMLLLFVYHKFIKKA